jgi:hypothetical protein
MRMKSILFLILTFFVLLNSCKYECPEIDKSLLKWIPQELGEKIRYYSQFNDTIEFIVNQKEYTDSYQTERQNKKSCSAIATLKAKSPINHSFFYITFHKGVQPEFYLNGNISLVANQLEKIGVCFFKFTDINSLTESFTLHDKSYNSIIFEADTMTSNALIYKIILAENYGLLKFFEKSGTTWTLIEE